MKKRLILLAAATALIVAPVAADNNVVVIPGYTSSTLSGIPPTVGTCSTSHSLSATDDVVVCGKLEVDDAAHFDGAYVLVGGYVGVGGSTTPLMYLYGYMDDGGHISARGNGYGNNNIIICSSDYKDSDFDHSTMSTNPTLFIHSATDPDSNNTQWLSLSHDTTDGVLTTGTGDIKVSSTGMKFSDGTDDAIIEELQETGLGGRLTIGLDETARTMVICDAGDMATDLGLSAESEPTLVLVGAATSYINTVKTDSVGRFRVTADKGLQFLSGQRVSAGGDAIEFTLAGTDLSAGDLFRINVANAAYELTDTDGNQNWLSLEPNVNQSSGGTGSYNGLAIVATETQLSATPTTGTGGTNNLIVAGTAADPDLFRVENDGSIHVGGGDIHTDYILRQDSNTFLGVGAVPAGLTHGGGYEGWNNTHIGFSAGTSTTSGQHNVLLGRYAAVSLTSGTYNTCIGVESCYNIDTEAYNIGIGSNALTGDPSACVAVGTEALAGVANSTTHANSVAVGYRAARYLNNKSDALTDIENSVFLGYRTSANAAGETNETVIGYDAQGRGSHTTTIGNTDTTSWMLYGGMVVETESVTCATDACAYNAAVVSSYYTTENAGGADVVTVTDGTAGQVRRFVLKADGTDDLTITPTNLANCTSITLDEAGESVTLEFDGTNWFIISGYEYAVVP